mgnify:CR=1 FL=1|tara:strand:- start:600 stop:1298 length:699 start_codon:yes stop_codon:yes gene_type:complete
MEFLKKAETLISNGKTEDAIKILDKHSRDHHEAAHLLFKIYSDESSGKFYDASKALNIIELLNKEKHIPAKYDFGVMYFKGKLVDVDYIKAEQLFREVANIKSEKDVKKYFNLITSACEYVGKIYENGLFDDVDKREALKYYKKACKNDRLLDSKYKVGKLIVEIYPDKFSLALPYLQEASEKEHVKSMRLLSKIYIILTRSTLTKLKKIDSGSVDSEIILDKINKIDEDIL